MKKSTKKLASGRTATAAKKGLEQPEPFTRGVTKAMVRQHAYELFRDKLVQGRSLTLEDWVLAEKDLVRELETEGQLQAPAITAHPEGR
jgi:hypothetical protein